MLDFITELCQERTSSQCSMPRWSEWSLVDPGQTNLAIDVADAAAGAGVIAPVNVKLIGSYISTGITNGAKGNVHKLGGFGAGAGVGAGWGLPFVGGKLIGKLDDGIVKKLASKVGGVAQSKAIDMFKDAAKLGLSGGTRLVYGPDTSTQGMNPLDFQGFVTVVNLGANFGAIGYSGGVMLFSRRRPIVTALDFIHVTAAGLMGGIGMATSVEVEANGTVYELRLE